MSKKSNQEVFKGMRWVYMTFAILGIIAFILILSVPNISETINNAVPDFSKSLGGMDVKYYILGSFGIGILIDIWYFYLITRYADGKSKGTLLLILLSLRVISATVAIFTTHTPMSLGSIIDCVTLFFLLRYRKENN